MMLSAELGAHCAYLSELAMGANRLLVELFSA